MKRLALALLAACGGNTGTISVSLVTAPGSTVLDAAQSMKLVLTNPHQVTTATRGTSGFSLELDLPASDAVGSLIVDAFDGSGTLIATGQSPPFPIGAITATLAVYMAAPGTFAAAPAELSPARTDLGVAALDYGAVIAGGRDATGAASAAISVYDTFSHKLTDGMAMPEPRSGIAVAAGASEVVYLFGGADGTGTATATFWRFVTSVQPNGGYIDFGTKPGFERTDEQLLPLGNDDYLLTGMPAAQVSGLDGSVVTPSTVSMLPRAAASVVATDGVPTTIFVDSNGLTRYRSGTFDMPTVAGAARDGGAVAALPDGKVLIACGAGGALRLDPATLAAETFPTVPAMPRTGCAIAVTSRHVVIASDATAEVFDIATLAPVTMQPLVAARTGAAAVALPNDQVLLVGGADPMGAPIPTLELFTPAPTE